MIIYLKTRKYKYVVEFEASDSNFSITLHSQNS
jgi:hypothetical protein